MAARLQSYYNAIRNTLIAALCVQDFASQRVERHNKPQIEDRTSVTVNNPELVLNPVVISYSPTRRVLIETSINSVRISAVINKSTPIDAMIIAKFIRFMCQRAEHFIILRRKPIKGYDISFLVTNFHVERFLKHKLVDFIMEFLETIDSEACSLRLQLSSRATAVSTTFYQTFFDAQ